MWMTARLALPYQNSTILQGCRIIWLATEIDFFFCKTEDVKIKRCWLFDLIVIIKSDSIQSDENTMSFGC